MTGKTLNSFGSIYLMNKCAKIYYNGQTSNYRKHFSYTKRPELNDLDMIELNAFLGLLYYTAILKSNHQNTNFASDGTGCKIFRCCMSSTSFLYILLCLHFDNPSDREEREKTDKLAASLFEKFVSNSQKLYQPGECVTIDEMMAKFRGRSNMMSYMPQKPGKYGLIIWALCDSKTIYFYNGYVYSGKGSDGIGLNGEKAKFLVPTQCVIRLTKPIQGSNRNVTDDNWFSSVALVDELSKRKLTCCNHEKKQKRDNPKFQPQKKRQVQSTLFWFRNDKTLCSFVPKQNKSVILISSMHHSAAIDNFTKKPEMIKYYNSTKGDVDETDKKCAIYSCSRRTRRWPLVLFYKILDLSHVNAYVLYN